MRGRTFSILRVQELGLLIVILVLGVILSIVARQKDPSTGEMINTFLNRDTLIQVATDASFYAIMAAGVTLVIITAGIDLSVGSTAALCAILMGLALKSKFGSGLSGDMPVIVGGLVACGVGVICGLLNGVMVVALRVHPFIITIGTLWIFRGMAFVLSGGKSILLPVTMSDFAKEPFGLSRGAFPAPVMFMILAAIVGTIYLGKMVAGRRIFAVGGNLEASRYAGVPINRVLIGVYVVSGLCAGLVAFLMGSYYGAVSSADANGYELYVIASAVVGGVSLFGGKGSVLGAVLGAILITLIHQAIVTLDWEQNYQAIIVGAAIIIAVVLDRVSRQLAVKRTA